MVVCDQGKHTKPITILTLQILYESIDDCTGIFNDENLFRKAGVMRSEDRQGRGE